MNSLIFSNMLHHPARTVVSIIARRQSAESGSLVLRTGKIYRDLAKADEALKIYEESFGKHYDQYPTVLIVKGLALSKNGKLAEGETILHQAVQIRAETLPPEHFWTALAKSALGENLTMQKRFAEAEPLLSESYKSLKVSQGADNPRTKIPLERLIKLYNESGKKNKLANENLTY